jgi:predicted enzyme related to lactoylglutathione lyase
MDIDNVLAIVLAEDFDTAVAWYRRLFDRDPVEPTGSCAQWWLSPTGGIQVNPGASTTNVVITVPDVDAVAEELRGRGFDTAPYDLEGTPFRLAPVTDPDGNVVTFSQIIP